MQTMALMHCSPHCGGPQGTQHQTPPQPPAVRLSRHGKAAATHSDHDAVLARQPINADDLNDECSQPAVAPSESNQAPQAYPSVRNTPTSPVLLSTSSAASSIHAQWNSWHPGPIVDCPLPDPNVLPPQSPLSQTRTTVLNSTTSRGTSDSISLSNFVIHKRNQGPCIAKPSDITFPRITPPTIEERRKVTGNRDSSDKSSRGSDSSGLTPNSRRHHKHVRSQLQPSPCNRCRECSLGPERLCDEAHRASGPAWMIDAAS